MGATSFFADILGLTDQLIRLMRQMAKSYERLPTIIQAEHAAIRENDISALGQTCQEKTAVGESVAEAFSEYRKSVDSLYSVAKANGVACPPNRSGLADALGVLAGFISTFPPDVKERGHLESRHRELESALKEFKDRFERIQPKIEENRTVIRRMLENQQLSYRFWVEVAQEESASYNSTGTRKSQGSATLINIQA